MAVRDGETTAFVRELISMEFNDLFVDSLLRWGHILSGVIWLGFLFFFNFVNGPFAKGLDDATRRKIVPPLMSRALFWFRWGAVATLVFGVVLFWHKYMRVPEGSTVNGNFRNLATGELADRARWVMYGMTYAIIMFFNVWAIIWPAQKRILRGLASGDAAPAGLARRAFLCSRINTYLAGPMLLIMVLAAHYGTFSYGVLGIITIAGAALMHLLLMIGARAGSGPV